MYGRNAPAVRTYPIRVGRVTPLKSRVTPANAYGNDRAITRLLRPGHSFREQWQLKKSFGWYELTVVADTDPTFLRRLASHLESAVTA
jgi:Bacterial phospholipase C, C-terminal domain